MTPEQLQAGMAAILSADLGPIFWARDEAAAIEIATKVYEAMCDADPLGSDPGDICRISTERHQRWINLQFKERREKEAVELINEDVLSVEDVRKYLKK